jgi:hypothetical protein
VITSRRVYEHEHGAPVFRVVRFDGPNGKTFLQQHPAASGACCADAAQPCKADRDDPGWRWGHGRGVPYVLYRLPDLIASTAEPVFVVEGEKCADALTKLGLIATTNAEGAGKWRAEYAETLRGRRVLVLPDNDEPGYRHAYTVARALAGVAASVAIVALPGLPEKGDIADCIAAGGTRGELLRLAGMAERALLEAVLA